MPSLLLIRLQINEKDGGGGGTLYPQPIWG